jgi:putrescine importer
MKTAVEPRRLLSMWDLIIYGIILIQPIAPIGIFGLTTVLSKGQVVTPILLAMIAMMCTAVSYGRLAACYPSAGSAYTYVAKTFTPELGFVIGWAMCLGYLVLPIVNCIYAALTLERLIPSVHFAVWIGIFAISVIGLNLRGISSIAQATRILMLVMTVVIVAFMVLAIGAIISDHSVRGLLSVRPLYDYHVFDMRSILAATSLAALTFIGFDGVTTLAEETNNPRRTIPLATVVLCAVTGIFSCAEVYLAQLVWPDYTSYHSPETAFMDVTQKVGGLILFRAMGIVLIVACFGTSLTGVAAVARLLYGMGRDSVLPKRPFGVLDPGYDQPIWNILLVGVVSVVASLLLSYEMTAELVSFGAFVTFVGVNASAIWHTQHGINKRGADFRRLRDALIPSAGLFFCSIIFWNLSWHSRAMGCAWLAVGLAHMLFKTKGFRTRLGSVTFDV